MDDTDYTVIIGRSLYGNESAPSYFGEIVTDKQKSYFRFRAYNVSSGSYIRYINYIVIGTYTI